MKRVEEREPGAVLERLRAHARALAADFELPLRSIDAEGPRVKRRYGICYADGTIKIQGKILFRPNPLNPAEEDSKKLGDLFESRRQQPIVDLARHEESVEGPR